MERASGPSCYARAHESLTSLIGRQGHNASDQLWALISSSFPEAGASVVCEMLARNGKVWGKGGEVVGLAHYRADRHGHVPLDHGILLLKGPTPTAKLPCISFPSRPEPRRCYVSMCPCLHQYCFRFSATRSSQLRTANDCLPVADTGVTNDSGTLTHTHSWPGT